MAVPEMGEGEAPLRTASCGDNGRARRDQVSARAGSLAAAERGPRHQPRGGVQRILVVDDEPNVARFLQAALQDLSDCEVGVAASGEQALRLLKERPFDLLITDYKMPGMDGIVLAGQVRVLHPRTVILMITAFADDALCRVGAAAGVQQVVHKPVKSTTLRALAARALGRGSED